MHTSTRLAFTGLIAITALTSAVSPQKGATQPAPATEPPAQPFDAMAKRRAIEAAAKLLTDDYVYPDKGVSAAVMLRQNLAAGTYDADATRGAFAAHVTKNLRDLLHDKHLRVFAEGVVPDDLPPGPPPPEGLYGFAQVDRLKGNIGYIVLNDFQRKEWSKEAADKAMGLVASTDALIIDLRHNGGGDPLAVAYLVSFFFDGKTPVHIIDIVKRKPGTTDFERQVDSTEPTPLSYLGKPVYLITSRWTFSGGEEFAYDMQTLKRGTLIGEATGGGAHPGGGQPIGPGLVLWVPIGRSESPITHGDWEGTGVQPDIAVPADQSFALTYKTALRALGRQTTESPDAPDVVTENHLLLPPRATPASGSETALRRLITGAAEGHPPYDELPAQMADRFRRGGAVLQADLPQLGALQSLRFMEVDLMGDDIYEGRFAHGAVRFTIRLGPDGKIDNFYFQVE
jgi:hypothetical protein